MADEVLQTVENIEVISRSEREALRAQAGEAAVGKERQARSAQKTLTPEQKRARKQKILRIGGGIGAVLMLIIWYGLQPIRGTAHLGICRTYAELQTYYPQTLKPMEVYWFRGALRIYYSFMNPFGEVQSELIECVFEENSLSLREVRINRKKQADKAVAEFNNSIPGVLKGKPDLIMPVPYKGNLMELWEG